MHGLVKKALGVGNVFLLEHPDPSPGPGEVLIQVHGCGVCGTDLHIESGEYGSVAPVIMGHEVSGLVIELGAGVDQAWLNSRVVTETFFSTCGSCRSCKDKRPNLCVERRSIGTHVNGGFASLMVIPATKLHRIPDWLSSYAATLIEPLACICHGLLSPNAVNSGDQVVVVGPGPMGQLAAQVARALGGEVTILGLTKDVDRLKLAQELGFRTTTIPSSLREADVAIDTSGSSGGIDAALNSLRRDGRFVQLGITGGNVEIPLDLILLRELTTRTGFASTPQSWRRALILVETREVDLEPLVSDVAALSEWANVFSNLRKGAGMKAVLDPRLD